MLGGGHREIYLPSVYSGASFNDIKLNLLNQPVSYDGDKAWNKKYDSEDLGG